MALHTQKSADRAFLLYVGILVLFGLAALMSAAGPLGFSKFNDTYYFIKRQIIFGLVPGLVVFLFLAKMRYSAWQRLCWVLYGLTLVLLVLSFIPGFGVTINNARGWLHIFGYSFQPSELAKLSIIILLSVILSGDKTNWDEWQTSLLPTLAVIAPAILLVLAQPDVGTASIMVMTVFAMLYVADVPKRYLLYLGLAGALCFVALILVAPYRTQRITVFLHPELDPRGVGYQMNQAFLAVGSGGFWGLGWGQSRQKFQYLPEVNADSIFAVIAEENGFLFSAALLFLVVLIVSRGLKIAKGAPDRLGYLLVTGCMVWFGWQSFLNIGAMVGALPLTGVPLPLVSHGGSAFMAMLGAIGLTANVSKSARLE